MKGRARFILAALLTVSTVFTACGDGATDSTSVAGATTSPPPTATTLRATTTSATTHTEATTTASPRTSSTTTTTTAATTTTTTTLPPPTSPLPESLLPGSDFALTPVPGAVLSVVGVRYDDVLNVRHAPGTNHTVIAELAPTAESIVATGRARMLTQSIWWEVTTEDGLYGWVSARFTARRGPSSDWTSFIVDKLGGIPEEGTMDALGETTATALSPNDPGVTTSIVMVVAPAIGDIGMATFDVVGLADDTTHALRVRVFGQPTNSGFSLKSAEVTDMCDSVRGPSEPDAPCA